MHETLATIRTSLRVRSDAVAEWRNRSISSLIEESFSMYVSVGGDVRLGLVVVVVADEVLDGVVREEPRNSLASWAASDLLGLMTSVGRWIRSIMCAIVNVLPEPVMPSSVW